MHGSGAGSRRNLLRPNTSTPRAERRTTYVKYAGTVFPAFGSDLKLYGRWLPEIQVTFHWAGSVIPADGDGQNIAAPSPLSFSLDGNGTYRYKATAPTADGFEFDGWYKDSDCTQKFQEDGEVLTQTPTFTAAGRGSARRP